MKSGVAAVGMTAITFGPLLVVPRGNRAQTPTLVFLGASGRPVGVLVPADDGTARIVVRS